VATKGVSAAYSDFQRMKAERMVQMDFGERAARNRCLRFDGDRRDRLYAVLKECVGKVEAEPKVGGEKRKRAPDDDGPALVNSYAALLAAFGE
jgi:hypothetical protein